MPSKSWHIKGFNGFAPKDSHRIVNGNLWGFVRFKDYHDMCDGGFSTLWESINVMEVSSYQEIQWLYSQKKS